MANILQLPIEIIELILGCYRDWQKLRISSKYFNEKLGDYYKFRGYKFMANDTEITLDQFSSYIIDMIYHDDTLERTQLLLTNGIIPLICVYNVWRPDPKYSKGLRLCKNAEINFNDANGVHMFSISTFTYLRGANIRINEKNSIRDRTIL